MQKYRQTSSTRVLFSALQYYCLKHTSLLGILLLTYVYKVVHNQYHHCLYHECVMMWVTVCPNVWHPLWIPVSTN